ncbi:MAG: multidrug effflux MFS transporter [Candidatus Nanopelagicales bacterium]
MTRTQPPTPVVLGILAALGMIGPFSIDTIFPAFASMADDLGVTPLALQQLVSVYLLAFASMSLLHGPLSDALGRKPVIISGMAVYALASAGAALSNSLIAVMICRAVQGMSAGGGAIISRAMVRDLYSGEQAQRVMSHIAMIFGLAPALAPIVGGLLLGVGDWRIIFWFLAAFGSLLIPVVWLLLPETLAPGSRQALALRPMANGLWAVWRNPHGRRLALAGMANFGGMFCYISAAPIVVVDRLGKGAGDFWMLFIPLIGGMVAGSWASGRLAGRMHGRELASLGYRISLGGGLANLLVVAVRPELPWAVALLPAVTFGVALAFPIITLAMLELFPANRGAAASVQSFVSLIANALIAGVIAPLIAVSLVSLAAGSLGFTVVAWLLWRRHLRVTHQDPQVGAEIGAYEPIDEM